VGDRQARDVLSRGERKILVAASLLAHVAYIRDRCGSAPIVLADDIPSELDETGQRWFLEGLRLTDSQIFATALQRQFLPVPLSIDHKVFHVERGVVSNLL
jgi:DNA replication and repair protein RecF